MQVWADFYQHLFDFRQIRYFDIEGKLTGLFSKALTSPDGKIRIPINESADEKSQIEEYLHAYHGEGIQHIACGCRDIYATIERLRRAGVAFMPSPPATYYEKVEERVPDMASRWRGCASLVPDRRGRRGGGRRRPRSCCSSFRPTPSARFSSSSFSAKVTTVLVRATLRRCSKSIEEDQIRRGVLKVDAAA